MEQNENIMPLLPQGITGFGSRCDDPAPWISAEEFKRLAYSIARNNQMTVSCTDSDLTGRNFYWTEYQKYGKTMYLLMNSRYPYLTFIDQMTFSGLHFIDPPENLLLPRTKRLILLEKELLNQPWENQKNTLDAAELSQIRFWHPMTIGEIIFNFWD